MSVRFNSQHGLIIVQARLFGPAGETAVDGVLGLDFMRGFILTVGFRQGEITLA